MKLPAKIEYAYKAVLELALRYSGDNPVQINTISRSQAIPQKFLVQLLLRLKNANIVNSSRGAAGGYYLTRPPSRISLADIFRAIDDTIINSPKKTGQVKISEADKLISHILEDVSRETVARLEGVTFDKLASQLKKEQLTYYI
jgi:Rrf2 family protein